MAVAEKAFTRYEYETVTLPEITFEVEVPVEEVELTLTMDEALYVAGVLGAANQDAITSNAGLNLESNVYLDLLNVIDPDSSEYLAAYRAASAWIRKRA